MMRSIVFLLSLFLLTLVDASTTKVLADAAVRRKSLADRAKYWGTATWFVPSAVENRKSIGACWEYESDSEYIVAMNSKQYGDLSRKSGWCFKKIRIYGNGKHVDAIVKDACPECGYGDLDLTPAAFKKLADLDKGVLRISWHEI